MTRAVLAAFGLVAGVLVAGALGGCGAATSPVAWRGGSPDGAHRAALVELGPEPDAGVRLLVDGREVGAFDAVALDALVWAADGLAVPVRRRGGWHVWHAGALGPGWEGIGELTALDAGLAYAALDAAGWRLVREGRPGPTHESIRAGSLVVERGRLAYVARDGGRERAVVDGVEGPPFEHVARLGFAGKGALSIHVGYEAEGARVVVDGAPGPRFDVVHELALAPDEPRWAAIVEQEGRWWVVRDGGRAAAPAGIRGLVISRDGDHLAWVEPVEDAERIVVDGTPGPAHARIAHAAFVPVTGALLYVALADDGARVVHDGRPGPRFDGVQPPVTSRAGRWGYVGHRRAGSAVVVDGAPVFRGDWSGPLHLAGERWACVVRDGARRGVLTPEGQSPIPRPFVDTLVLTDAHWAIGVADEAARALRVWVDGEDVAAFDVDALAHELGRGADGREAARALVERVLASRAP